MKALAGCVLVPVAFFLFVSWAADAFDGWELAVVVGAITVGAIVSLFGWAMCRVAGDADRRLELEPDPGTDEFDRIVAGLFTDDNDFSTVRHGGLGQ